MIEPDHFDEKLAGGGSGPTICSTRAFVTLGNTNNLSGTDRRFKVWLVVRKQLHFEFITFLVQIVCQPDLNKILRAQFNGDSVDNPIQFLASLCLKVPATAKRCEFF